MSKNDITGDEIKSKVISKEYEDNFDKIFRNKPETYKSMEYCKNRPTCFCETECEDQRLKAIAQNGNIGYAENDYERVEKDYQENV